MHIIQPKQQQQQKKLPFQYIDQFNRKFYGSTDRHKKQKKKRASEKGKQKNGKGEEKTNKQINFN